jgi:hypothetical protein
MPPMPMQLDVITQALATGLAAAETELAAEQAVHGLDALAEIALHPILTRGLHEAGYAAFRETPYPGQPEILPKESERLRCDLVVTSGGTTGILDSVRRGKELQRAEGTLFAEVASEMVTPPVGAVPPEEALWLEVKTIGQSTYVDGVAGPNRSYTSQFSTCLADIRKLASADAIEQAALAIVLFNAAPEIAQHDLTMCMHKCLDRRLPVVDLRTESFPIADRIGNAVCTVGLVVVRPGVDG